MILYITEKKTNLLDNLKESGYLITPLIGRLSLTEFAVHSLKNYLHFDDFVIDVESLDEEGEALIEAIETFRKLTTARLTIIFPELSLADHQLHQLISLGVYNIVTATDRVAAEEELAQSLSENGMTRYLPRAPENAETKAVEKEETSGVYYFVENGELYVVSLEESSLSGDLSLTIEAAYERSAPPLLIRAKKFNTAEAAADYFMPCDPQE
jgi:hypothetical protein